MYDVDTDAVARAATGSDAAVHGALDVRDAGQWRTALTAFGGAGGLDVLVNNAGVLAWGSFTGTDLDSHRRMVGINVTGVVNGSIEGKRFWRARRTDCC